MPAAAGIIDDPDRVLRPTTVALRLEDPVEFRKLLGIASVLADEPRGVLLTRLLRQEIEKHSIETVAV